MNDSFSTVFHMPPEHSPQAVEADHQDFLPLYTRVHVWGMLGDHSAEGVLHGVICSPLVPYYHGHHLFSGYLVKLDHPLTMTGPLQSEVGEQGTGQLQAIFVHYSSLEPLGPGEAPTMGDMT